jgi:EAL domain-containing protein (putative c-di-GMP-specific phosphodiesterase class I)
MFRWPYIRGQLQRSFRRVNTIQPNITLTALCKALTNGEFFYFYQPIVSLESGIICGAEALIRWKRPDGSIVLPASFIPLAESTGFIAEMTLELLSRLLDDLRQMNKIRHSTFVHLNLSAADLKTSGLANTLSRQMAYKNVELGTFRVEIVEGVFMPPVPGVDKTIAELAAYDIPVILNDFSAGYTTLRVLSQLPLTAIKLALNIVQRAIISRKDFRILRHLVNMGHQLGLDIIAEGVETEEMYDLTLSTGSTHAQGYYFSFPLSLSDYLALLQQESHWSNYPFGIEYLTQIDLIDLRRDVIRAALTINKYKQEDVRQRALARLPELDYQKSDLGIWLTGVGREWAHKPAFEQLLDEHRLMHETAERLIQAALQNEPREKILQLIDLFSEQSGRIAQFLHEIERIGLRNHYQL